MTKSIQTLTWAQVNAWRLSQQGLSERAQPARVLDVVTRLSGVQAQLMSAAELALWVRVQGITATDIQRLLWDERALVKTWAMRGTLHLLPSSTFGDFVAACGATTVKRPPSYYTYHKVTSAELTAIIEFVPDILSATPITREQLADAVVERTNNPKLREVLLSGWGALLKPSARRGDICFGPNQGEHVTFVRPDQWLGNVSQGSSASGADVGTKSTPALPRVEQEPMAALQTVLRNFLTTYGPATLDEFARWWGIDAAQARKLFKTMADELTTVDVAGWQAQLLSTTLPALTAIELAPTVRLLPYFDPYTIAVARHSDALLPAAQKNKVYRAQGWISPVVVVDGRIAGVWEHAPKRNYTEVTVTLFEATTGVIRAGIGAEAEGLGYFLNSPIKVTIGS